MGDTWARDASIVVIGVGLLILAGVEGLYAGLGNPAPDYIGSAILVLVGALAGVAKGSST